MIQTIPEKFIKDYILKSGERVSVYQDYHNEGSPNPSFQIKSGNFTFYISGREELSRIKDLLYFALEVLPDEKTEEGYMQEKYGWPPKGEKNE